MLKFYLQCLLTVIFCMAFATPSLAVKRRSCDAEIRVELLEKGAWDSLTYVIERYSSFAHAVTANSARRSAAGYAQNCARAVWSNRWHNLPSPPGVPTSCSYYHAFDMDMVNIKCEIYDAICGLKRQQNRPLNKPDSAKVYVRTSGGSSACNGTVTLAKEYVEHSCSTNARRRVCGLLPETFN